MPNLTEVARSRNLLLKVEGHSVTSAMGDGEFIKSSTWIVGGHFWEIHLRGCAPRTTGPAATGR